MVGPATDISLWSFSLVFKGFCASYFATMRNNKRSRKSQVVAEDLLRIARKMWKRHEYKGRDSTTEETQFITFFGCPVGVSITLWALLDGHEYIPDGGRLEHMLWI